MKTKTISRILTTAAVAAMSVSSLFAQTNLGADCGCSTLVKDRPVVDLGTATYSDQTTGELLSSMTLTCDKNYLLTKKIYVKKGQTLTIKPGTVVKGRFMSDPAQATALIAERGGKIIADGTKACPIVMTGEQDKLDGTTSIRQRGQWGGLVLLGTATNNLSTVANKTTTPGDGKLCVTDGVGYVEGFTANVGNGMDLFGAGPNDPYGFTANDDNDNSGILRYVSVRYAGADLNGAGNELNGVSLGSVGRGTTIDYLEVISAADDNVEIFGGTVDLKHVSSFFGADDMVDWDLGWSGRAQFLFTAKNSPNDTTFDKTPVTGTGLWGSKPTQSADNGFEADDDDQGAVQKTTLRVHSDPHIYNTTFVSNGASIAHADNTGPAAIMAKEETRGHIYNSLFINFRSGLHLMAKRSTTGAGNMGDAYDNWSATATAYDVTNGGVANAGSLVVKNNTFLGCRYPLTVGALTNNTVHSSDVDYIAITPGNTANVMGSKLAFYAGSAADQAKFAADGNDVQSSIDGITYQWSMQQDGLAYTGGSAATYSKKLDVVPATNIATDILPPTDGFFTPVAYRGAFSANETPWISDYSYQEYIKMTIGPLDNPTDLDKDGDTDGDDFGIFAAGFGQPNK